MVDNNLGQANLEDAKRDLAQTVSDAPIQRYIEDRDYYLRHGGYHTYDTENPDNPDNRIFDDGRAIAAHHNEVLFRPGQTTPAGALSVAELQILTNEAAKNMGLSTRVDVDGVFGEETRNLLSRVGVSAADGQVTRAELMELTYPTRVMISPAQEEEMTGRGF